MFNQKIKLNVDKLELTYSMPNEFRLILGERDYWQCGEYGDVELHRTENRHYKNQFSIQVGCSPAVLPGSVCAGNGHMPIFSAFPSASGMPSDHFLPHTPVPGDISPGSVARPAADSAVLSEDNPPD